MAAGLDCAITCIYRKCSHLGAYLEGSLEVAAGVGRPGLQRPGRGGMADRVVHPPLFGGQRGQRCAEVPVRARIVGAEAECLSKLLDGGVEPPLRREGDSQQVCTAADSGRRFSRSRLGQGAPGPPP